MALGSAVLGGATLGAGLLAAGVSFNVTGSKLSDKADEAWEQMGVGICILHRVECERVLGHPAEYRGKRKSVSPSLL